MKNNLAKSQILCPRLNIRSMCSPISYMISSLRMCNIQKFMRVFRRAFLSPCLTPPNKGLHSLHNFAWMVLDTLLCLQKLKKIEDVHLLTTGCFKSLKWWNILIDVCLDYLHNLAYIELLEYTVFRTNNDWIFTWFNANRTCY